MMTKRSNHMPTLIRMHSTKMITGLRRIRLIQNACGTSTWQLIIRKYDHQNGPNARLTNANRSNRLPEYQAMNSSVPYARPTIMPVPSMILQAASTCSSLMMCFKLNRWRAGMSSVNTIANPEKIAPATKYGGKIVVCQPGSCEVANSNDTTEWTENTSGVARPARIRYSRSQRSHSRVQQTPAHASL